MKVPRDDVTVASKIIPGFTDTNNTNPSGDGKTFACFDRQFKNISQDQL